MGSDNFKNSTIDDGDMIKDPKSIDIYKEIKFDVLIDTHKVSKALFLYRVIRIT